MYIFDVKYRVEMLLSKEFMPYEMPSRTNTRANVVAQTSENYNIPIVTAASSLYFDRLVNLVGSIHAWSPATRIIIYDIGLTHKQANLVACWTNTDVVPFPFEEYPPHVKDLSTFAWKIIALVKSAESYGTFLFQDSGQELWKDPGAAFEELTSYGYFFVNQPLSLHLETHSNTFSRMGILRKDINAEVRQCAGGIIGFTKSSPAFHDILLPALDCALDKSCIAPSGESSALSADLCRELKYAFPKAMRNPTFAAKCDRPLHQYDQSVLSLLIARSTRYSCLGSVKFSANRNIANIPREDRKDIVFFSRRWMCPKPFARFVRYMRKCAVSPMMPKILSERSEKQVLSCGTVSILPGDTLEVSHATFIDILVPLLVFFPLWCIVWAADAWQRAREVPKKVA